MPPATAPLPGPAECRPGAQVTATAPLPGGLEVNTSAPSAPAPAPLPGGFEVNTSVPSAPAPAPLPGGFEVNTRAKVASRSCCASSSARGRSASSASAKGSVAGARNHRRRSAAPIYGPTEPIAWNPASMSGETTDALRWLSDGNALAETEVGHGRGSGSGHSTGSAMRCRPAFGSHSALGPKQPTRAGGRRPQCDALAADR